MKRKKTVAKAACEKKLKRKVVDSLKQKKKMKRKKSVAKVACEKKLKRKVVDNLEQN